MKNFNTKYYEALVTHLDKSYIYISGIDSLNFECNYEYQNSIKFKYKLNSQQFGFYYYNMFSLYNCSNDNDNLFQLICTQFSNNNPAENIVSGVMFYDINHQQYFIQSEKDYFSQEFIKDALKLTAKLYVEDNIINQKNLIKFIQNDPFKAQQIAPKLPLIFKEKFQDTLNSVHLGHYLKKAHQSKQYCDIKFLLQ